LRVTVPAGVGDRGYKDAIPKPFVIAVAMLGRANINRRSNRRRSMVGVIKQPQAKGSQAFGSQQSEPTPRRNTDLPFRTADFDSLPEALDYAARGETGINFYNGRGRLERSLTYGELRAHAVDIARRMMALGLPRGARVALTADMAPEFVIGFFACQYAGLQAVPLPVPTGLGGRQGYEEQLTRVLRSSQARVIVAPDPLLGHLHRAAADLPVDLITTLTGLGERSASEAPLVPLRHDEASHVQYSSGSTRHPLGIVIDQAALMANARSVARHGLALTPGDRAASWLPFYHDMGLIGFMLIPITSQVTIDYMHTDGFARRPLQWLRLISENRCTLAFSPTFGYELCVRRAASVNNLDLDLSSWRVAGIGGELIRPETLNEFATTFGPFGFDSRAFLPSYGLAEATLAFSFGTLNTGLTIDRVRRDALVGRGIAEPAPTRVNGHGPVNGKASAAGRGGNGAAAHDEMNGHAFGNGVGYGHAKGGSNGHAYSNGQAHKGANGTGNGNGHGTVAVPTDGAPDPAEERDFAICGRPLPGYAVQIRDKTGQVLPDRRIGRVFIAAPSLMTGYDRAPEATRHAFADPGWLDTGDMGYMIDGSLVITGRQKDLIIVNGRNIWPQDLEWHAEQNVDELRSRDSAAFSVESADGKEVPVILVQCRLQDPEARTVLRDAVHAAIFRNAGIDCRVVLIPPRSLPFTTSGKLSRARAKQAYLAGAFEDGQGLSPLVGPSSEAVSSRVAKAS